MLTAVKTSEDLLCHRSSPLQILRRSSSRYHCAKHVKSNSSARKELQYMWSSFESKDSIKYGVGLFVCFCYSRVLTC